MVAMVATGQKSTLGAVARHPGAGVGYLCRLVGSSMTGGRRPRRLATTTLAEPTAATLAAASRRPRRLRRRARLRR